ncbi:MAG: hypothetical protein MUD01_16115, partial [Chloroflexaceae bacterium]|nr:hypothetical protein [Chloroflexaceae bacterium]
MTTAPRAMPLRLLPVALVLLLAALGLLLLLGQPRPWTLDLGKSGDSRFFYGFYNAEQGVNEDFRWTGRSSGLMLHGAPAGAFQLELRLNGERKASLDDPIIRLVQRGQEVARFPVQTGWRVYRVLLPPGAALGPDGNPAPLEIISATSRP